MSADGKEILIVVDMQNDFIDGALGTDEAKNIVDKVAEIVKGFSGEVIFTRDTHLDNYMETQEGKNLPVPHCIKGTSGWQLHEKMEILRTPEMKVFDKPAFGSVELGEYLRGKVDVSKVVLVGLCTDICVISNAMIVKANLPEVPVEVVADCCAGVTPESHDNALAAMKMCQIAVV